MSHEKLGTLAAVISGLAFASLPIFSKLAYLNGVGVFTVLFWRFFGAALLFPLFLTVSHQLVRYDKKTVIKLLLLGALGYTCMSAFFLSSVERIPASLSSMLLYSYPAFVCLVSVALKRELLTMRKIAALVIVSVGLVCVLGASFHDVDPLGILLAIGAAIVYTVYIVAGNKTVSRLDPINATMYIMLGSAAAFTVLGLATNSIRMSFTPDAWLDLLGIIIFPTVLAILSFWFAVKYLGPVKTSIISTIEPLFTVILAWMILGEGLTGIQLLGGIFIILGIIILQL